MLRSIDGGHTVELLMIIFVEIVLDYYHKKAIRSNVRLRRNLYPNARRDLVHAAVLGMPSVATKNIVRIILLGIGR